MQNLLPFDRKSKVARDDAAFATCAHLLAFCACFGYAQSSGRPQRATGFLNSPYPIDFDVFLRHCSDQVFMIVLASAPSENVLHDEGEMCAILEDYAAFGGEELSKIIDDLGEESFLSEIARRYVDSQDPEEPQQI